MEQARGKEKKEKRRDEKGRVGEGTDEPPRLLNIDWICLYGENMDNVRSHVLPVLSPGTNLLSTYAVL